MSQKFLSNIELNAGLVDGNDAAGTSGQILSSTGTGVEWIDQAAITGSGSNKTSYEVKNSSGATILKGKGVMAVGTDGNSGHILIDEMVADGTVEPRYFMGVLEDSLDNGEIGTVIAFGELDQFNTNGQNGETWTNGQILWCDPDSAGDFTTTQPTAPAVKIPAAFILKASTQGKIQIRVQANEGLHELHDTRITTQSDGEILVWDNTNEYWFNDNTLTVDYTNGYIGIGTAAPTEVLHINAGTRNGVALFESTDSTAKIFVKDNSTTNNYSVGIGAEGDNLAFYAASGGTERMRIDSSGSVGIGTTSPNGKLEVAKGSEGQYLVVGGDNASNGRALTFTSSTSTSNGALHTINASSTNGVLAFATASSERMRIDNTGNVGIGTTSPDTELHIAHNSDAGASGWLTIEDTDTSVGSQRPHIVFQGNGTEIGRIRVLDTTGMQFATGSSTSLAMTIDQSQRVGIGTTSPDCKLDIRKSGTTAAHGDTDLLVGDSGAAASTAQVQILGGASGYSNLYFSDTSAYNVGGFIYNHSSNYLATNVNGSERMRIDSSGKVGIGTTSPSYKLDINGATNSKGLRISGLHSFGASNSQSIELNMASTSYSAIRAFQGSDWTGVIHSFGRSWSGGVSVGMMNIEGYAGVSLGTWNSPTATFLSSGNVGIGTTTPYEKLEVNGGISATGTAIRSASQGQSMSLDVESGYGILTSVDWGAEFKPMIVQGKTIQFKTGTGSTSARVFIDNGGDVGIGTTSPTGKVNIRQATLDLPALYLSRYNADDNPLLQIGESTEFSGSASYGEVLIHSFNRDIVFSTESTDVFTDVVESSLMLEKASGNVGIGTDSPTRKLSVSGSIEAGGKTTYTKTYSSIDTTGHVVAALVASSNGQSSCIIFTCYGGGGYQRIIYDITNQSGNWYATKNIDEGVNSFDVVASSNGATTMTFTFKGRTASQSYSPSVTIEHHGVALNTTYL